jgi:hypothetical protein
VKSVIQ